MTAKEYRKYLDQLGLSIVGAGRVFGVSPRHAQRFANGETPIPSPLAKLVRVMIEYEIPPEEIENLE